MIREASFYHTESDGKTVVCDLCPHSCRIAEGKHGICRSRVNRGGKLYAESYAHPCACCIDPVEKKPLLHFHPGSTCLSLACTGCNFSCLNCQNSDISQAAPSECESYRLTPDQVVTACLDSHCPAIAYTYTEPLTWFEYMYDTACLARQAGIKNILVSAGYVQDAPLRQLCSVLDAANIDLKSFSDDIYRRISHGSLAPVLHTLGVMRDTGVWLEITNLLIPGVNDSPEMLTAMCKWLADNGFANYPLHFSRFFPQYRMKDVPATPLATLASAAEIARKAGLKYVYIGNAGEIDGENTLCPSCGRLLVRRDGYRILENHLTGAGTGCPNCGTIIPGRW
ncbi:MAG: AmmeMemoRadiSam system radical SAM enzyme [Bacteroidales bacterium]|jgi:pyruvate formate lyase activating enzyme|nr:AmmeMemoRadiSam system radical SAM enzyme [Bacteroidales bacterium]MCI2122081.1 AmmeMemoRadiSam system radical SAM enzyme [Bacteroidales bacterium]MCI2146320.1 AmmeMemoRadiSam system radical SAM enzyme [Bacteroidales bacterium]